MPAIVADTVVFVRALLNPRSACGRVLFDGHRTYSLALSRPLLTEVMQVVARPSMIDRFDLRESDYLSAMTKLLGAAAQAKFVPLGEIPSIVRDPNDDMVLATAVVSGAEYLVTEDKDLLVLDGYAGIRVCTCRRFMEIAETGFG